MADRFEPFKLDPFLVRVFHAFSWLENERKTMKTSQYSDTQTVFILKQGDEGVSVAETCRKAGISQATYFRLEEKYASMLPPEMKKELVRFV
ncbi:hypothetical protein GGE56_007753 [Rhizobium leguminosarum]|nr:transposase family protein [Rhizobium leguminosarum bv. viciae]MBB4346271.1 hypothetical protein [Rhizobium leguminosarum]MBB5262893.1 hypothetical protein [Rhizobium leguminosarum]MBB6299389.1 hypothetical protein [Rhizobium leguminosarum]